MLRDGVGTIHDLFDLLENLAMTNKLTIVNCKQCGIAKQDQIALYCDACTAMLEAIQTPWFTEVHSQWVNDNIRRIEAKKRMLGEAVWAKRVAYTPDVKCLIFERKHNA